jgi:hypothetical protein
MRFELALTASLLVFGITPAGYSQDIALGFHSGWNISDIHGHETLGKWSFKPGPTQLINLEWSYNKFLGLQSGVAFSSVRYEYSTYGEPYYHFWPHPAKSFTYNEMMDFTMIRVPVILSFHIPSALQFNLKAGMFYSFMLDHSLSTESGWVTRGTPEKYDYGYLASAGILYPLNNKISASFNIQYLTGRKNIFSNSSMKHGSSEYTFGLDYHLKTPTRKIRHSGQSGDSSSYRLSVAYYGGLNYNWNPDDMVRSENLPGFGPSLGFSLILSGSKKISLISGVSFVRRTYSIKDSISSLDDFLKGASEIYYVESKLQMDYAIVPALVHIPVGRSRLFYMNTGPWLGLKLNARNMGVAYEKYSRGGSYELSRRTIYNDIEGYIKDTDFGWLISGGFSWPIGAYTMNMEIQYSASGKDVYDGPVYLDLPGGGSPVIRNRSLSFLIGFTLPASGN